MQAQDRDLHLYEKIFNSISDIVYIKDTQGRYILGNDNFAQITNLDKQNIKGKNEFELFDKKLAEIINQRDQIVIQGKKPLIEKYEIKTKSGKKILYETEKTPIFDDNGNITAIVGIGRDITKSKVLEKTLIESKNHQKAILDNLPFMSWLKDNQSRFLYVNEHFLKLTGATLEDTIGKTDLDFFPKDMAEGYRKDDFEVMASKKKKNVEEMIKTPDGNVWFETYKMPIFNLDGKVIGTTGFARDITERKMNEIMKNEFISVISHELRTPLTAIKGSLGLISSGKLNTNPQKIVQLAEIADKNCTRLINLINDILDIEKIEAGKMRFDIKIYELSELIEKSVEYNKSYVEQFSIELKILNTLEDTKVKVDKDRFIQVMTNLISNATKFAPEGSKIEISSEIIESKVRINIRDYGSGIPKDIQHKIFDRFVQGDSSDTRSQGGTGLGLNICETVLNKMRGSIGFDSKENKGTTFYFDLPIG